MGESIENQAGRPTQEQLREADRNGVLRWKEMQDILHIKSAATNACVCELCKTVRSLINAETTDKSLAHRLDLLSKMRQASNS